jgi:ATP-binding cassette subfamily F protein 3
MDKAHREVRPQEALDLAGSLLFSGDDIQKKVSVLSGGERSRVALGQILLQKAPFLLLDEPTNHLDFDTVEALTQALMKYQGTVMVVSHDRSFIGRVATRILEIRSGQVEFYPGTYQEYLWSLERGVLSERKSSEEIPEGRLGESSGFDDKMEASVSPRLNYKEQRKLLDRRMKQLDKILNELEKRLDDLQIQLDVLNVKISNDPKNAYELTQKMGDIHQLKEQAEAEWLAATDEKEKAEKELQNLVGEFN